MRILQPKHAPPLSITLIAIMTLVKITLWAMAQVAAIAVDLSANLPLHDSFPIATEIPDQ